MSPAPRGLKIGRRPPSWQSQPNEPGRFFSLRLCGRLMPGCLAVPARLGSAALQHRSPARGDAPAGAKSIPSRLERALSRAGGRWWPLLGLSSAPASASRENPLIRRRLLGTCDRDSDTCNQSWLHSGPASQTSTPPSIKQAAPRSASHPDWHWRWSGCQMEGVLLFQICFTILNY